MNFDLQEIKALATLMEPSGITEITIEDEGTSLLLKRATCQPASILQPIPTQQMIKKETTKDENITTINSPMAGTFYPAPRLDSEPFVKINSKVTPKTTVCIIDAMKVMNRIDADTTGTIVEILVEIGQAIEKGQPLFRVRK